jgi:DNA mismatch endonuclease (patch repair protein)
MADIVDQPTRSRMMSGIGGKNSRPEMQLRRGLHRAGLRYRLHLKTLPGSPDIVLARWGAVVFVHGCFWHRHSNCRLTTNPATRPEFWQSKFAANVARDARNVGELLAAGWRVAVVWECSLGKGAEATVPRLLSWLEGNELYKTF